MGVMHGVLPDGRIVAASKPSARRIVPWDSAGWSPRWRGRCSAGLPTGPTVYSLGTAWRWGALWPELRRLLQTPCLALGFVMTVLDQYSLGNISTPLTSHSLIDGSGKSVWSISCWTRAGPPVSARQVATAGGVRLRSTVSVQTWNSSCRSRAVWYEATRSMSQKAPAFSARNFTPSVYVRRPVRCFHQLSVPLNCTDRLPMQRRLVVSAWLVLCGDRLSQEIRLQPRRFRNKGFAAMIERPQHRPTHRPHVGPPASLLVGLRRNLPAKWRGCPVRQGQFLPRTRTGKLADLRALTRSTCFLN